MKKLRIVTFGISGWGSIAYGAFRDARRFPSTRWYPVPSATRTPRKFGIRPRAILCRLSFRFAFVASLQVAAVADPDTSVAAAAAASLALAAAASPEACRLVLSTEPQYALLWIRVLKPC